jgi:hypothetical protein
MKAPGVDPGPSSFSGPVGSSAAAAPANVNGGIEGEPGRVHFVDLTAPGRATSTLCTHTVRFVDLTTANAVTSTLCTLIAADPDLPTQRR